MKAQTQPRGRFLVMHKEAVALVQACIDIQPPPKPSFAAMASQLAMEGANARLYRAARAKQA